MATNRFGASKFRNAVSYVPAREEWYRGSLPASSSSTASATSSFSSELKANRSLVVTMTPAGDVTWRTNEATGTDAAIGKGKLGGGTIGDWDLGSVEGGELVVGGTDGSISLYQLSGADSTLSPPVRQTPAAASTITSVTLHPTANSLVLASSISQPAAIWDLSADASAPVIQLEAKEPKGMWSVGWSWDGRLIAGIGKSGTCYIWDPRASTQPTMTRVLPLQPLKPARVVWVGEDIFVTSTSKMRSRDYHLFSISKSLATVFTQSVDTNTAPLIPVVDQERRIVYLAGKGDMTTRQVELSGPQGYQETLHPLPHAVSAAGLALASPTTLPVMQAQIATVLVPVLDKDGDAVLPFGIRVPRRQLIDFHDDLYPEIRGFVPEGNAASWLGGEDKLPLQISLDPSRRKAWEVELEKRSAVQQPIPDKASVTQTDSPAAHSDPQQASHESKRDEAASRKSVVSAAGSVSDTPSPGPDTGGEDGDARNMATRGAEKATSPATTVVPAASAAEADASPQPSKSATTFQPDSALTTSSSPPSAPTSASSKSVSQPVTTAVPTSESSSTSLPSVSNMKATSSTGDKQPTAVQTRPSAPSASTGSATSNKPYNPTYSRKFLAAKAPLIPAYDMLPSLATLHPDSLILKISRHLAFFPVQGPGGRLGVHALAKRGRMPVGGQGYLSGGVEIVDFAVEPFGSDDGRTAVAVAGEDGAIRVWRVGKEGVEGPGPESEATLKGRSLDKIVQVAFHPTAKDLLVVASNDHTSSSIRLFDVVSLEEAQGLEIAAEYKGIFSFAIEPAGNRFAVATKSGQIVILDHASPTQHLTGKAHDSPRSFQLAWFSSSHLISVGFNKGSQRRINLYSIKPDGIDTLHSLLIDISPSVLFPVYDADTHLLFVWGKGERAISAYEINVDSPNEPISKLPTYTAGEAQVGLAFKSKFELDVKKVEVMKALRLTAKTMEEVTFSIPRNKPEFFQDDIYIDTLDTQTPLCTAQQWLDGTEVSPRYKSLRPDSMTPLSQAPNTTTAAKAKFVPGKDVMTEEQKKTQEMDALFNKAKADESSDEEIPQKGLPPPDDDW